MSKFFKLALAHLGLFTMICCSPMQDKTRAETIHCSMKLDCWDDPLIIPCDFDSIEKRVNPSRQGELEYMKVFAKTEFVSCNIFTDFTAPAELIDEQLKKWGSGDTDGYIDMWINPDSTQYLMEVQFNEKWHQYYFERKRPFFLQYAIHSADSSVHSFYHSFKKDIIPKISQGPFHVKID